VGAIIGPLGSPDRHFPYAGLLMHRGSPVSVDDVVTIDARVVAGLMSVTGPVTAAAYGRTDEARVLHGDDLRAVPDPERTGRSHGALINRMLSQLADANPTRWRCGRRGGSLAGSIADQNVQAVQPALSRMPTGGAREPGPWASAAINDFGGSKLSAYLQVTSDRQRLSVRTRVVDRIEVSNEAPDGLPDYGCHPDKPGFHRTGTANVGWRWPPRGSAFRATMDEPSLRAEPTAPSVADSHGTARAR
jgi:hypothetical protein